MVCKKCKAQVFPGARFCASCGEKVETDSVKQEEAISTERKEETLDTTEKSNEIETIEAERNAEEIQNVVTNNTETQTEETAPQQKNKFTRKKLLTACGIVLAIGAVAGVSWKFIGQTEATITNGTKAAQSENEQDSNEIESASEGEVLEEKKATEDEVLEGRDTTETEETTESSAEIQTTTASSFENKIIALNTSENALEQIDIYAENYSVREPKQKDYWDKSLFYGLEDISTSSDEDGQLNNYNIEAKTLQNKDTGNKIDYIIYRNPDTNKVNKIVSMEYLSNGEIEIVDYYYTDERKVDFIFVHTETEYTPSYATRNKLGERFYYMDDAMVKWRVTTRPNGELDEKNYIATKTEWGDQEPCRDWKMLEDVTPELRNQFHENAVRMLNAAYNTYDAVVDTESINLVDGWVTDEYGEWISGATIRLFAEGIENCLYECVTDENGKYELYIPSDAYTYRLEIEKEGFCNEVIYGIEPTVEIVELIQENVCLFQEGEAGWMYFSLRHAFMDEYISEATIHIRKGINNRNGDIYDTFYYDEYDNTEVQLEPGNYTLEIECGDYQTAFKNIRYEYDGSIKILLSPTLNDGEVRIVLDWGEYPQDLDSHLFTPYDGDKEEDEYHIGYNNKKDPYGNHLDVDDTDGYGPETMTIRDLGNGCYKYYVADYTHCSEDDPTSYEMSQSGAQVNVYTSEGEVQNFYVPKNRSGVIWEVFEIRNGKINQINRYYSKIEDKKWWNQDK